MDAHMFSELALVAGVLAGLDWGDSRNAELSFHRDRGFYLQNPIAQGFGLTPLDAIRDFGQSMIDEEEEQRMEMAGYAGSITDPVGW